MISRAKVSSGLISETFGMLKIACWDADLCQRAALLDHIAAGASGPRPGRPCPGWSSRSRCNPGRACHSVLEHFQLGLHGIHTAAQEKVAGIRVGGHQAQSLLFAHTTDQDGRVGTGKHLRAVERAGKLVIASR